MIHTIREFVDQWGEESKKTSRMMAALTDASLAAPVGPDDRNLGRIAWHVAQSIGEIATRTGLVINAPAPEAPVPSTALAIREAYAAAARSLADAVQFAWTDDTLKVQDAMYGETWTRAASLHSIIVHEIHHRGQMSVLLRQAGLRVPGTYGPAREEWATHGMPTPAI